VVPQTWCWHSIGATAGRAYTLRRPILETDGMQEDKEERIQTPSEGQGSRSTCRWTRDKVTPNLVMEDIVCLLVIATEIVLPCVMVLAVVPYTVLLAVCLHSTCLVHVL
jgi:hypothetical protein